ncbi:hypothetical protein ACHAXT_001510 [Thalassiosira profunda]
MGKKKAPAADSAALPTAEECAAALAPLLTGGDGGEAAEKSLEEWRHLVRRCLSHGTDYDRLTISEGGADGEALAARAEEAGAVLAEALEGYLTKLQPNLQLQENDHVICAVVEALWLAGCLLESTDGAAAEGEEQDEEAEEDARKISQRCLVSIIGSLTAPRPWMSSEAAAEKDDADDMDEDGTEDSGKPLIPITSLQTALELPLLEAANLLPHPPPTAAKPKKAPKGKAAAAEPDTPTSFLQKKLKKLNTDMYYRQHKFNLLAEEGEGYAKLWGLLVLGLRDGGGGSDDEQFAHAKKYVRELIGAFDLDPNRVLDLALDALEWELKEVVNAAKGGGSKSFSDISKAGKLADGDGWWGLEAVKRALSNADSGKGGSGNVAAIHSLLAIIREMDGDFDGDRYKGRAVAHLLGFKYRSYRARAAAAAAAKKDGDEKAAGAAATGSAFPRSLHLVAAFLSAHDVLDPHALLPHLSAPLPGALAKEAKSTTATTLVQAYQTHCSNRIVRLKKLGTVSLNASNKAPDKKEDEAKADEAEKASFDDNAAVGLFRALLAVVGDWDTAAAFLAHASVADFAKVAQSSDDDVAGKLLAFMDSAVLAACTLSEGTAADICAWVEGKVGEAVPSNGSSAKGKPPKNRSSILPPSNDATLSKDSTLAEVSPVLRAPLGSLAKSGKIRSSQSLYVRLCRLYKAKLTAMEADSSEVDASAIDEDTLSVLSVFLVPSLSLFPSDTTLPNELWSVLKHLTYEIRYKLYSAWRYPGLEKQTLRSLLPKDVKSGNVPKPLDVIESEIETGIAARYVLKRISKDNIKDKGRQLAKTSHNNPLVVFTDILGKIESYDNMILMMVDTFEFVTQLGLDVMGYCLLVSLGGGEEVSGRSRVKMGGLNTEQWLASLETFTGAFYKKFPDVELRGILVYLTKRFKDGHGSELGVLRSLIKTAGGYGYVDYDSTAALSNLQLDGRCGSRLLKRETSSFGVVDDINRHASQRLRSVLQSGDLGAIILILLAQMRSRVLYSKPSDSVKEHIKVIGNTYDDCEAVLCLLLEYLSDSSDDPDAKKKFAASMPSLLDLQETYGVDAAVAWMLCRPLVRKSLFYKDDSKLASSKEAPAYLKPFTSSSPEMAGSYKSLLTDAARESISSALFETFYSLSVYDISCPEERYKEDMDRIKKDCERLVQLQRGGEAARGQMAAMAAARAAAGGTDAQIRQATLFTKAHQEQLDRLKRNVDNLNKDFQRQEKRCKLVLSQLEEQKSSLVGSGKEGTVSVNSSEFAPAFMTFCVYPRFLLSPANALFCAYFVKILHKIKVPGFLTIELIDNIVNAVTGSLYCMTEDEAGNCSIFFNEIWKCANSWRYDNDAFASELKDTPGSQLSREFAEEHDIGDHALTSGITHDDYKTIYTQWHQKIGTASIGCLKSSEYMHIRCALIVLSRIVLVFPTQPKTGDKILKTLAPLQSDDNARPDIRATAQGYSSQLAKARDDGMWKEENIAVTKARQEREKMKAEERKKKLAQQHEDMKKEQEAIQWQLGDGGRDGRRPDRRDDRRPWGMDPRSRGPPPPLNPGAPTFTPKSGDSRDHGGRPGDSRRQGMERDNWERDRRQSDGRDNRRQDSGRGERRKRGRSPEPGEDTERAKRSRGGERGEREYSQPTQDYVCDLLAMAPPRQAAALLAAAVLAARRPRYVAGLSIDRPRRHGPSAVVRAGSSSSDGAGSVMAEFGEGKTVQGNDSMIEATACGGAAEIDCKPLELTAGLLVGASVLALGAAPALAELPTASDAPLCSLDDGDTAFMMFAATVVMMQTPAMGLAQAGMIRRKNSLSMLMQVLFGMVIGSLLWTSFGFSLAFGPSSETGLIGDPLYYSFLQNVPTNDCLPQFADSIPGKMGSIVRLEHLYASYLTTYAADTQASVALYNTHISACSGSLVWSLLNYSQSGKWSMELPVYWRLDLLQDIGPDALTGLLNEACASGDTEEVQRLIRNGSYEVDQNARSICTAAADGDVDELQRLLNKGVSVNLADYDMRTPLHIASALGKENAVELLCSHPQININAMDRWHNTPLTDAARQGHTRVASLLRSNGAVSINRNLGYRLCSAAASGDIAELKQAALNEGANLNAADYDARTALHLAASEGQLEVMKLLLDNGASPSPRDRYNFTPLDDALREGQKEAAVFLREWAI